MKKDRKQLNKHDWSGMCMPGSQPQYGQRTFSVGIFKWIPTANGKGLKKSAVIYRVRGRVADAEKVYERAELICDLFDGGIPMGKSKSCTV